MLFCVGTMGIMGSLQSGLNGDNRILFVKAALDGISAVVLASAYGGGVLLSAVPVLVYQGAIALAASALAAHVPESLKTELNIPGGIIIAALGLNMLGITRLKPVNMLPALLVPPAHLAVSSIFSF
jgi:uncharacterized membrane protein YqgA involved in biofilm formation